MAFLLPLLKAGGTAMLPGLLNHLFGGDPAAAYRKNVNNLLAPQNMSRLTNQNYQQNLGSPGYAQAQNAIGAGANASQNNLMSNLGARGLGTSGTGAILSSLMPSLVGSQMGNLRTGAYNQAQGQAQNTIQQQIAALNGSMQPSQTQQMFAGGLSALGPILQQLLSQMGGGAMNGANNAVRQLQQQPYTPNQTPYRVSGGR